MIGLSADQLVGAWETAKGRSPAQRASAMLAATHPDVDERALAQLTVGQRDAWLLTLREQLFGSRIECVTDCPSCRERSEFTVSTRDLLAAMPADDAEDHYSLNVGDVNVVFRLPTISDLDVAARSADDSAATRALLSRIVLDASNTEGPIAPDDLPSVVVEALEREIGERDPLVEINLDLNCPSCSHTWRSALDVAAIVFMELASRAQGVLLEVHTLARHYHWSEADILALSPIRRRAYLDMVGE